MTPKKAGQTFSAQSGSLNEKFTFDIIITNS